MDETVIRDWIASNRAPAGFWAIVRDKYGATQVVWECKNYTDLKAEDFHQALYYMTEQSGKFVILVCRSLEPLPQHFYDHVKGYSGKRKALS